jgi:hypothetical protein
MLVPTGARYCETKQRPHVNPSQIQAAIIAVDMRCIANRTLRGGVIGALWHDPTIAQAEGATLGSL